MPFELPGYSEEEMYRIESDFYIDVYDEINDAWNGNDTNSFEKWADLIQSNNEKYNVIGVPCVSGNDPFEVVINYVKNTDELFTGSCKIYEKYIDDHKDHIIKTVRDYTNSLESDEYIFNVSKDVLMTLYSRYGWLLEGMDLSNDYWLDCNEISELCIGEYPLNNT